MAAPSAVTIEDLLVHADWVQRLAHRLVVDAASADDLVQQTWLVALERKPEPIGNVRAWLTRVVSNLARSQWRSTSSASRRERAVARPEALPSTEALVQEAVSSRELVDQVLGLDERYRNVILLRYFRGKSVAQIAKELDRPVPTIRTWLQRGIARLHGQLDREYGDRQAWCIALAPLARGAAKQSTALLVPLAVAGLIAAVLGFGVWHLWAAEPVGIELAALAQAERLATKDSESTPLAKLDPGLPSLARIPASVEPEFSALPPNSGGMLRTIRGQILDSNGTALAGIELEWIDPGALRWTDETRTVIAGLNTWIPVSAEQQAALRSDPHALLAWANSHFPRPDLAWALIRDQPPPPITTETDGFGLYEIEVPGDAQDLRSLHPDWALLGHRGPQDDTDGRLWVAARRIDVSVTVLDFTGLPNPDATVDLRRIVPAAPPAALGAVGKLSGRAWKAVTDSNGQVQFHGIASSANFFLDASRGSTDSAFARLNEPPGGWPPGPIEVEIRLGGPEYTVRVTGKVYLPSGKPASRTTVVCGTAAGTTDKQGLYALDVPAADWGRPFLAARSGWGIAEHPGFETDLPHFLSDAHGPDLRLLDVTLEIRGRVIDASGAPIAGAKVSLANGYSLPRGHSLESIAGGLQLGHVQTNPDGEFMLGGLRNKDYELIARQGKRTARSPAFPAGRFDVELQLKD